MKHFEPLLKGMKEVEVLKGNEKFNSIDCLKFLKRKLET